MNPFCSGLTEFKTLHSFSGTLLFFVLYDLIELLHNQIQIIKKNPKNYAIAFFFSKHGEEVKVVYKSRLKKRGFR